MQGSNTKPLAITSTPQAHELARAEQSTRLLAVYEAASTSAGIYAIANACCNEGHATVEDMERITHLARQLCRNLDQLGLGLSSTPTN